MSKILFISYQFPPLNVGGSRRPFRFARDLPEHGWSPLVMTLAATDYDKVYTHPNVDNGLLSPAFKQQVNMTEVGSGPVLDLYTSKWKRFKNIFMNIYRGNEADMWMPQVLEAAESLVDTHQPSCLYVTAPPFSMMPVAEAMADRFKLPLVLDMRDAWTMWNSAPYATYWHYRKTLKKERQHLERADAVIATSKQTIDDWLMLHPHLDRQKFHCIPNGFDVAQAPITVKETVSIEKDKGQYTIAYMGNFYYDPESRRNILKPWWSRKWHRKLQYNPFPQDWRYRSPYYFLSIVSRVLELNPALEQKLTIQFAGHKEPWLDDMVAELGVESVVEHVGFLGDRQARQLEQDADALLLTSAKRLNGRDCFIAGKTYDYLRAGKPIVGVVCEGAQKDLLEDVGMTLFLDPDKVSESAEKLADALTHGKSIAVNTAAVERHRSSVLAGQLANVLSSIT